MRTARRQSTWGVLYDAMSNGRFGFIVLRSTTLQRDLCVDHWCKRGQGKAVCVTSHGDVPYGLWRSADCCILARAASLGRRTTPLTVELLTFWSYNLHIMTPLGKSSRVCDYHCFEKNFRWSFTVKGHSKRYAYWALDPISDSLETNSPKANRLFRVEP